MLKVEHLHIVDDTSRILIEDATFCLPNFGIVSIYADNEECNHALAQVLSGIRCVDEGTLTYNDTTMNVFNEEARSLYRSTFVTSLFHDFQIRKDKDVLHNVTMGLEYPIEKVQQQLRPYGLQDVLDVLAEDLSVKQQWGMVLARCLLRQPMMLVFDVASSSLSSMELEEFYVLIKELRSQLLIVIIGDQGSYSSSNRVLEFSDGYLMSDSITNQEMFPQINHNIHTFQLTRSIIDNLHHKIHGHIRWKLRCASILCVMAFICLSTAIFSTTLDITDIQMRLMDKQGSSLIAIEKIAEKKEGSFMSNYYDNLKLEDIQILNKELNTNLILGYEPVDSREASYFTYGTSIRDGEHLDMNTFTIMEASSNDELGFKKMYGKYPSTYREVALSSSQAYQLLKNQLYGEYEESEEQIEEMLGKRVLWYGNSFIITGIFPSNTNTNVNMDLDMTGYNGDSTQSGTIMDKTFFVKRGFTQDYQVLKSSAYNKSYKRMISKARVVANFDHISSLDSDVYYYNGKEVIMGHDLKEDEVLFDFPMALDMGYRSVYINSVDENQNVGFEERIDRYERFADEWIGKEVTIQAYTTINSPNSSSMMSKKVKVKGFIIPITYDYLKRYVEDVQDGCAYMNTDVVNTYSSENIYIKEAFYQSADNDEQRKALSYLNKQPTYAAYLTNSRILQFFVVDLKNMNMILVMIGSSSFLLFIAIMIFLLRSSVNVLRSELSTYYIFGEQHSILKKVVLRYFESIVWMRSLFGWFCGSLALGTLILMIYFTLSASPFILWSLSLPLVLLSFILLIMKIAFKINMHSLSVIEEEFKEDVR